MNKPELLTTAANPLDAEKVLKAGADAINIGNEVYSLRMPGSFSIKDIKETIKTAASFKAKVYVSINALLHQHHLEGLEDYIKELNDINIDAIIFGDPAVYMATKKVAPEMALFWNTETTTTNYQMINFWAKKGIRRAILARELSLESVLETKMKAKTAIQAQIHGMTCIFHSKRELVSSYLTYKDKKNQLPINAKQLIQDSNAQLFIKEHDKEERHPIFEDHHGTHVMSTEDICMINYLRSFIDGQIDSLKIDGLLKSTDYQQAVIAIYREAIDTLCDDPKKQIDPAWITALEELQPIERPLSTGFYFREQIY